MLLTFRGLLYNDSEKNEILEERQPDFFQDLNLDQIVNNVLKKKGDYGLERIFYNSLKNVDDVIYRQDIFRDLEDEDTLRLIKEFSEKMEEIYRYLSEIGKLYKFQKERWLLDSAEIYCEALETLLAGLESKPMKSQGISSFVTYLREYISSERFVRLRDQTKKIRSELDEVKFTMTIKTGGKIVVEQYNGETDFNSEIRELFERFRENRSHKKLTRTPQSSGMSHVEAALLGLVARLYPETFRNLTEYYDENNNYVDPLIQKFHREIQFYLEYIEYILRFKEAGLNFCIPEIRDDSASVYCNNGFDIGLAQVLLKEKKIIVTNDFILGDDEKIMVVTGPNNGGKTTFARMFGQIHYLASLGLPVPGTKAELMLFDNMFTHFEREEDLNNQRGKLEDDLVRIKYIIEKSTPRSIIIINEMLSSTTLKDAVSLGKRIVEIIRNIGCLCVYVTFLDELASLKGVVSMVSSIVPENPEKRTYRFERRPPDGLAYAMALARKYRVTYEDIRRRIQT